MVQDFFHQQYLMIPKSPFSANMLDFTRSNSNGCSRGDLLKYLDIWMSGERKVQRLDPSQLGECFMWPYPFRNFIRHKRKAHLLLAKLSFPDRKKTNRVCHECPLGYITTKGCSYAITAIILSKATCRRRQERVGQTLPTRQHSKSATDHSLLVKRIL